MSTGTVLGEPLIGAFVEIATVTGDVYRGELFAFDGVTQTIVLRDEPRPDGGTRGVRMLHCSHAKDCTVSVRPPSRPPIRALALRGGGLRARVLCR